MPYYLAPLWDANLAAKQTTERKRRESARQDTERKDEGHGKVPKELREKLKKAKAAKGLLKALEEEVRKFVKSWEDGIHIVDKGASPEMDSEDEEIVFVGRNGQMHDIPPSPKLRKYPDPKDVKTDQLVFDSLADDHGANFGYVRSFKFHVSYEATKSVLGGGLFILLGHTMVSAHGPSL